MTIKDLKDLEKIMKLCRKQGVYAIEIDGVKFQISPEAPKNYTISNTTPYTAPITPGGITEDTKIVSDSLTDEEMLFYSAGEAQ